MKTAKFIAFEGYLASSGPEECLRNWAKLAPEDYAIKCVGVHDFMNIEILILFLILQCCNLIKNVKQSHSILFST